MTVTAAVAQAASSGGGCSLQSESGAIDWTLWLLALLSLAALRGYRRRGILDERAEMPFYVTQLPFMLKSSLNRWLQCLLRHIFLTVRTK